MSRLVIKTGSKAHARKMQAMARARTVLRISRGSYIVNSCDTSQIPPAVFPWWGNKRKLAPILVSILLAEKARGQRVVSCFLGTGVVEGTLHNMGASVQAYDLDANVVNMHRVLTERNPEFRRRFALEAANLRKAGDPPEHFTQNVRDPALHSRVSHGDPVLAAKWLLGTKCSFMGLLKARGRLVRERLDAINVRRTCQRVELHRGVEKCRRRNCFEVIRDAGADDLLFLDPPYLLEAKESQYHAGDFGIEQHKQLAALLCRGSKQRKRNFVLCHRESRVIRSLYAGCEILKVPAIMSLNRRGADRGEIVVIGRG